jgi:protein involved in polysaccharide export with SLBB domain
MLAKKNSSETQNRRVTRVDPPALEEAIAAAQGLTDDVESQIEIAAQLMGMSEDEVRPVAMKAAVQTPVRRPVRLADRFSMPDRNEGPKVVVVERKRPRLVMPR